jgi:hypothetical protein
MESASLTEQLPAELLAYICGFLRARDLVAIARAARVFTQAAALHDVAAAPQEAATAAATLRGSAWLSSIVEEGARRGVAARHRRRRGRAVIDLSDTEGGGAGAEAAASGGGGGAGGRGGSVGCVTGNCSSWLRVLWQLEHPLVFTKVGPELVTGARGARVSWPARLPGVLGSADGFCWQAATCDGRPMVAGTHYAEFRLRGDGDGNGITLVGLIGADVDAHTGRSLYSFQNAWLIALGSGFFHHAGCTSSWPGQPTRRSEHGNHGGNVVQTGDALGLELDVEAGTLAVYHLRVISMATAILT